MVHEDFVRTPDGRRLSFAEHGARTGRALILCHGTPGSRFQCPPMVPELVDAPRVIVPERPGYGRSDPHPDYDFTAWVEDLRTFVDVLGIDTFALAGFSNGGAFAIAGAAGLPERVDELLLLSSAAPPEAPGMDAATAPAIRELRATARTNPDALAEHWASEGLNPDSLLALVESLFPPSDQAVLALDGVRERLLRDCRESLQTGPETLVMDYHLASSPWPHLLPGVRAPVRILHGTDDLSCPIVGARYLANVLAAEELTIIEGAGHLFVFDTLMPKTPTTGQPYTPQARGN
jgi:pimeloyl-ACP methyl ester carboxylesterase